ncbi:lipoprotein [Neiella marina]|uniref:Lipoprotein n=1 Tax=Neiella holothuriorum TaxID=2870530 RepID=A0ABS7EC97_9GAMM|nr:lipoprotein [Neiella holothuriorum]MBW8189954.1 lipoprotein [Neiella holothuriorum]
MLNKAQSLAVLTLLTALLGLVGCGQKGPLYLPEEAPEQLPQSESQQPQPANAESAPSQPAR